MSQISPQDAATTELWRFDDLMRRFAQALFSESDDPKLNERRALYRLGLLQMAEGLANDSYVDFDSGARYVEQAFHTLVTWNVPPPEPILAEPKHFTVLVDRGNGNVAEYINEDDLK